MRPATVETHDADGTRAVGRAVASLLEPGDALLVAGELGAGKTTFAQGVAAGLGIDEPVVSPTFTLAREYRGTRDGRALRVVHADLYRLDTASEVLDLGLEELVGDDGALDTILVVEWGDVAAGLVPGEHLEVRLTHPTREAAPDERTITCTPTGRSWAERAARLADVLAGAGTGS